MVPRQPMNYLGSQEAKGSCTWDRALLILQLTERAFLSLLLGYEECPCTQCCVCPKAAGPLQREL